MGKKREVILKRFFDESGAETRERQRLLGELTTEILKLTKKERGRSALVVSYFVDYHFGGTDSSDGQILEDVFQAVPGPFGLFLIVDGPGGFGLAAEQIVNVCRTYGGGKFVAVVPKMAKSAATVICLGAEKILLGPAAELGPIDPQIRRLEGSSVSASVYVDRYNKLIAQAEKTQGNIEPFLMELKAFDPVIVENLEREIELSKKVAEDVLFAGMWKGKRRTKQLTQKLKVFTHVAEKGSHGRAILFEELESIGVNVGRLTPASDLWGLLWELYNRTRAALGKRCTKIIETKDVSITGPPSRNMHETTQGQQEG